MSTPFLETCPGHRDRPATSPSSPIRMPWALSKHREIWSPLISQMQLAFLRASPNGAELKPVTLALC